MKNVILTLCLLLVTITLLTGCGQSSLTLAEGRVVKVDGGYYRGMNVEQLNSQLEYDGFLQVKKKDFLLVNVHTPYAGEIAGTDLFIPYDEIEQNLFMFPEDRATKIVLYCNTGRMSISAARTLVKLGFTNVWHLDIGMLGWERDGFGIIYGIY